MRVPRESQLREQLTWWLRAEFPGVIYRWDLGADLKLTVGQAARHKRLHPERGYPDLFIAQPRGDFAGLFVELKAEGTKLYKANGELYADPHLVEQANMLDQLMIKGYKAVFAVGLDDSISQITNYLLALNTATTV